MSIHPRSMTVLSVDPKRAERPRAAARPEITAVAMIRAEKAERGVTANS
jgi:hypothetical protein